MIGFCWSGGLSVIDGCIFCDVLDGVDEELEAGGCCGCRLRDGSGVGCWLLIVGGLCCDVGSGPLGVVCVVGVAFGVGH